MKKTVSLLIGLVLLLAACGNDKITGIYNVSGYCPSFFESSETIEFANGDIVDRDNLHSYEFISDDMIEFKDNFDDVYVGTFKYIEEDTGFSLDHDNGNYTCTFTEQ